MTSLQRALVAVVAFLAASGLAADRPRLGVLVVVDQLSAQDFQARLPATTGGFRRLVAEGAAFDACLYQTAPTVTSVGHATLVTGAWPQLHGIVANEWYERASRQRVASTEDPAYQVLGRAPVLHDGTAPTRLRVPTLADTVRSLADGARAVSISGKDRSGILMGGRAGLALWLDEDRPTFTTSTYYAAALPPWAAAVNSRLAQRLGDGGAPGQESLAERPGSQPVIDTAEVDLALEALSALKLGQGEAVDLLEVSFSGHDRVGHRFGPDSPEAKAEFQHLDRELGRLLAGLDARLGKGGYVLALSADHGVAPRPELLKGRGLDAGRVDVGALRQRLEEALDEALGAGDWLLPVAATPGFVVEPALVPRVTPAAVARLKAVAAGVPGVADLLWAPDLPRGASGFVEEQYRRGYVPGRSADLVVVYRPHWIGGQGPGTTHSTPWLYDRAVPLVFFGAGVRPGRLGQADAVDLAPTLARLLGVPPPAAAQGKVLEAVFR